jgi:hypothetical protein
MIARISRRIATGAKRLLKCPGGLAAVLLAISGAALSDGLSLDQARAMAGWVTPGDAPGFPVTITAPGHYRLTSDLIVPAGTGGIVIRADNVVIDLNGFAIRGPARCAEGKGCADFTAGISQPEEHFGALVANGTVEGFRTGVEFKSGDNRVENLAAVDTRFGFVLEEEPAVDADLSADEAAEFAWSKPAPLTGNPGIDATDPEILPETGGPEIRAVFRVPANAVGAISL